MEHLHARFITAGFALGLGVLMLAITIWQLWLWTVSNSVGYQLWATQMMLFGAGLTLVVYSFLEIEHEARRTHRRKA